MPNLDIGIYLFPCALVSPTNVSFRLREMKNKYLEDLKSTEESRHFFDLFAEQWNSGSLSGTYFSFSYSCLVSH